MDKIIEDVLKKMTLEEKARLCSGDDDWHTFSLDRFNLNSIRMGDGPNGLRMPYEKYPDQMGSGASEPATCFPTISALANSWDPNLVFRVAEAVAEECRFRGVDVLLAPGINIKRSPLSGRNFEYFSEDPYLSAELGCAYVNGVQTHGIAACLKHFAANSQEYCRMVSDSIVDLRAMRELYLYAFEQVVTRSKPQAVMASYNKINGSYACENEFLLHDLLYGEWNFQGAVISDWYALNNAVQSVKAGLSLEMPASGGVSTQIILDAIDANELSEQELDRAVEKVLSLVLRMNCAKSVYSLYDTDANHRLSTDIAADCIVLLKNKQDILPLQEDEQIALIGDLSVFPRLQGNGSSKVNPIFTQNLKNEIENYIGHVICAQGYSLSDAGMDDALLAEAIEVAETADKVVVLIGLPDEWESEGFDRDRLSLPENQNRLVEEIARVNPNTIVILSNGSPVTMPWIDDVKGVLESNLLGEGGACAIARVLFGEINPGGKLAESFPLNTEDIPSYRFSSARIGSRNVPYKESIYVGYRYYQSAHRDVLFPFGFGLSYTTFTYRNLRVSSSKLAVGETLRVEVDIENTGKIAGKEVVQLYIRDLNPRIFKPMMELKGFQKINLNPKECKNTTFHLSQNAFQFYDVRKNAWNVYSGDYQILIGSSSEDIRCSVTVHVYADEDYVAPYQPRDLISYHRFDSRIFTVPDIEFETLLGREIGTLEENRCLDEYQPFSMVKDVRNRGLAGKIFYYAVMNGAKKKTVLEHTLILKDLTKKEQRKKRHQLNTATDRMVCAVMEETPLNRLPIMSAGEIDYRMIDALLKIFSKEKGGMKQLRKAYFRNRKYRREKK